jgi:hypothetical protein
VNGLGIPEIAIELSPSLPEGKSIFTSIFDKKGVTPILVVCQKQLSEPLGHHSFDATFHSTNIIVMIQWPDQKVDVIWHQHIGPEPKVIDLSRMVKLFKKYLAGSGVFGIRLPPVAGEGQFMGVTRSVVVMQFLTVLLFSHTTALMG